MEVLFLRRPVSLDCSVCGREEVRCRKIGKVGSGQVTKGFQSQTEHFICDLAGNREPLEWIERGESIVRLVL